MCEILARYQIWLVESVTRALVLHFYYQIEFDALNLIRSTDNP